MTTSDFSALATNDPAHPALAAAREAASFIAEATDVEQHDIALTLGSGWGEAASLIGEATHVLSADEVPGFHKAAVAGHPGTLTSILTPSGKRALVIGARTHYYEGRGVDAVVHGVRTAAALGAKTMILTNGCGGLNPSFHEGMPVLISDHINGTFTSPLKGAHFVDMTDLYSLRIRDIAREIDPTLLEGVYLQLPGPHYETPAEIKMARTWGADLVGMSTALEAIAARAAGLEVFGISLVTNMAAGIQETPLNHEEVLEAGRNAGPRISRLLADIVGKL
ncbi:MULTISPECIES: purine-nucleoside phosphorylase [unclassified Rothia (in: high G+C Gram-positive bacteria)]|uniref:purine-nucleoside phosphorylase n=1 Tax=unclassified Rothia (in: high G+C Gram-positive bacteria) TaxID=2689056 RepID=UPI00195E198D|nr:MULTISPECIES: purine-nucleoside phosphorylase [unclassified Rothia (in: high G+C Gram-positive bacteria)]MBM7051374.1 purine-nucleoside phosphorylase [Rothia sp. ZJ1223]QRZ61167.1 purine-nucleoside phosphorylase [Rothia sp. ZJ932]